MPIQECMLLLNPRIADRAIRIREEMSSLSTQELVDAYNRTVEIGFINVIEQGLRMAAVRYHLNQRLGQSPVEIIDGCVIRLTGKVELRGGMLVGS